MTQDLTSLSAYDYELPQELIAQKPASPRDTSRLMIVDRNKGSIDIASFRDFPSLLQEGDSLIFNDTKVIPARLHGKKPTGAQVEVFLLRRRQGGLWEAMVKPGRKMQVGEQVLFPDDIRCTAVDILDGGQRLVQFDPEEKLTSLLETYGEVPLPPYIQREQQEQSDKDNYQTIFAKEPGAVAAPTAGLHFTERLIKELTQKGVTSETLTLHVGLGTFLPVQEEDIRNHPMHAELFTIPQKTAQTLTNRNPTHRQITVGTTCCRALEAVATPDDQIPSGDYETDIFIYPGYKFKYVTSLLTNFHLPKSTLLMLVSAFAGYDLIREAYSQAIAHKFRFYSYGDAMLLL